MLSMGDDQRLLSKDDQSWAFPILPVEENGARTLIDSGKILMNMTGVSEGQAAAEKMKEEAPPPPAPKEKKRSAGKRPVGGDKVKRGGGGEAGDHEMHIWTERERRKKMKNMFSNLHAMLPHLHPRADKSSIIDEAVIYIKKLQQTLENLEKLKDKLEGDETGNPSGCDAPIVTQPEPPIIQSREAFLADMGATSEQPPVSVANPGAEALQACYRTWTSPNLVLNVCGVDAHINVVCSAKKPGILTALLFLMDKYKLDLVSAHASSHHSIRMYTIHARLNGGPQQFPEASFVEETFKQAASELILWVDS